MFHFLTAETPCFSFGRYMLCFTLHPAVIGWYRRAAVAAQTPGLHEGGRIAGDRAVGAVQLPGVQPGPCEGR